MPDVLVVDDEPVVRDGIRRILEAEGLIVETANDGAAALAHPGLAGCRLVVCDLVLPDRPGADLIAALRRSHPDLPVVLITGYATSEQVAEGLKAGAADFLAKPFEASELLEVVRRNLRQGSAAWEVSS